MLTNTMNARYVLCAAILVVACFMPSTAQVFTGEAGDDVSFQILPEKVEYRRGESATIRLILINRASVPLHVSLGGVGTCGKGSGYADLLLLDDKGRKVPMLGCDVAELQVPDNKVKEVLMNSGAWATLRHGEIYGSEVSITLPLKKGHYRLVGEVHPPSFPEGQAKMLKTEHIHVLQTRHSADPVTIRIK
jgi:hypothetical protein